MPSLVEQLHTLVSAFRAEMRHEASLRGVRLELARAWAASGAEEAARLSQTEILEASRVVRTSGLRLLEVTPDEEAAVAPWRARLQAGWPAPDLGGPFMACLLFYPVHELGVRPALEGVPLWMLADYVQMLFEPPSLLLAAGEAERYAQHLLAALQALEPAAARLGHVAEDMVVRSLDVLQAYFHDGNLRALMAARGHLIERFLRRRRYHLDHPFFPRAHTRPRLGLLAPAYPSNTESAFTLAHLMALHGTSFEVFVYAMAAAPGPMEDRCRALADHFVVLPDDLRHQVGRIRRDELDLLLVMTNVATSCNPATFLCAHRLARVQVASMASPVTTGLPHMDWFLSADDNDFANASEHYSERLWRMPGSLSHFAFCPDEPLIAPIAPLSRVELGLPAEGLVFFSALNFYKLVPELVADWEAVLAAVPDSVLALLPFNPWWQVSYPEAAFRRRLERQLGVDSRRLRVLAPVPTRAHVMALLAHADVYLDGFPFAGAVSLFDPLALGVPAVVREGQSARSRHGAVGMRMFERNDLIARDSAEYVRLAIELGRNADRRAEVRAHLQQRLAHGNPMLDHARFAATLVPALRELAAAAPADTQEKAS